MALRCRGSITIYPRTGLQKFKMSRIKTQNTKNGAVCQHCSSSSAPQLPNATITPAITVDLLPGNGGILWL